MMASKFFNAQGHPDWRCELEGMTILVHRLPRDIAVEQQWYVAPETTKLNTYITLSIFAYTRQMKNLLASRQREIFDRVG